MGIGRSSQSQKHNVGWFLLKRFVDYIIYTLFDWPTWLAFGARFHIISLKLLFMLCEHPCRHFDKFSRLDKSLYTGRMAERTSDAIASLSLQELVLLTCHVGTGMNFWTIGQHETQMPCTRKSFCQCPQRFGTKQCGNSFEGYLF